MLRKEIPGMEHYATRTMMGIPLSGDLHNPTCEDTKNMPGGGSSKAKLKPVQKFTNKIITNLKTKVK